MRHRTTPTSKRIAPPSTQRSVPTSSNHAAPASAAPVAPASRHSAALYSVRVRPRGQRRPYKPLGDIDDVGTSLLEELERCLHPFEQYSPDGQRLLRSRHADVSGHELLVMMEIGETRVAAEIFDRANSPRLRQTSTDTHYLRCGVLFQLPPAEDTGWLALHVNHRRGIKTLLEAGLERLLGTRVTLELNPFVGRAALQEAVQKGHISTVRLFMHKEPDDPAVAATRSFIPAGEWGTIEVKIKGGAGTRVRLPLLDKYLRGAQKQTSAEPEIIEFAGMVFDEAKLEVDLGDGRRRTFNVERPEAGHAMTIEMEGLEFDGDGEPTEASVFAALRSALQSVR